MVQRPTVESLTNWQTFTNLLHKAFSNNWSSKKGDVQVPGTSEPMIHFQEECHPTGPSLWSPALAGFGPQPSSQRLSLTLIVSLLRQSLTTWPKMASNLNPPASQQACRCESHACLIYVQSSAALGHRDQPFLLGLHH